MHLALYLTILNHAKPAGTSKLDSPTHRTTESSNSLWAYTCLQFSHTVLSESEFTDNWPWIDKFFGASIDCGALLLASVDADYSPLLGTLLAEYRHSHIQTARYPSEIEFLRQEAVKFYEVSCDSSPYTIQSLIPDPEISAFPNI